MRLYVGIEVKRSRKKHISLAVDVVPLPLDWEDIPAFEKLGEKIMAKAEELGINIRWGRDFTTLKDYPHFELMESKVK